MAQIVGGFGVPHTPVFPHFVKRDGPDCEIAKLFGAQKERACGDAAGRHRDVRHRPSQHLLPRQPADLRASASTRPSRRRTTSRATCRTTWCRRRPISPRISGRPGSTAGFDVGMTQNFSVDHSVTVPLHFLTPEMNVPVMPFFISGHVPPLPSAQRCYALGQAVGRAIEAWPENKRVVVMGSGSFSLEVGGPRMAPGRSDGVPDPDWCAPRHQAARRPADRHADQGIDAASDAEGRQRRRRNAELDRHARRHRQPQAELRRAADAERPRLRRVAVELEESTHDQRQGRRGILQAARLRHQDRLRRTAGADRHRHDQRLHRRRRCRSARRSKRSSPRRSR